ncbi:patatin-like phospholipase family protein [Aquimarina agarilytica]|uniref:patatin-like phospholipase family protein n=1 Tax=Aquimarina agarilytica TaxID=1087449 RepID=UPI000288E6F6|nr:patatin-like phospholipase family protein [Aquimarina agarilytica]
MLNVEAQQQQTDSTDVKVGLVLSGGGAKGLAHIGVLKVIEKAGVRLDYISGSSMGAIVGGLYASGYSAKQLDSLFHTVDFNNLIQDILPRDSKTFYEKEDAEKYALTLPIVDKKVSLPKGISNGQNFYNFYSKLTTHVRHISDFGKLPIPFFCTGTDIETGEGLIFDKGYLPDAVTASGALPTVYSPVKYKGRLVTDGGVTNNYPIEEIKKRGVELVIGVDVQDTLMNKKQLNSVTNIMLQISNFRTIKDMKRKQPLTDVYIKPDIKDYSVISFDRGDEIIDEGARSAEEQITILKEIAAKQSSLFKKETIKRNKDILAVFLDIEGHKRFTRAYIKGKLRLKTPSFVSLEDLNKGLDNLYSTGNFERIRYKIRQKSLIDSEIQIKVEESPIKSFVRFGLHYDNLYKSAALVNYTRKNLFFKSDVLSLDGILGDQPRYNFNYYIDKGYYWSVGINHRLYQYERALDFAFVRNRLGLPDLPINFLDFETLDITSQLYLETILGQKFGFRIGIEHKFLKNSTETIGVNRNQVPGTVFSNINYYSAYAAVKYDSLDDKYFPTTGVLFEGSFSGYPFSSIPSEEFEEFAVTKLSLSSAAPIKTNLTGLLQVEGGVRLGNTTGVNSLDFFLGGFGSKTINNQVSFYGYDFLQLSGESYVKGLVQLDYNFWKKHHLNVAANFANVGDEIFNLRDIYELKGFSGYALGYGYNSPIGPIQVKYSFSDDPKTVSEVFFSVGYWF